MDLLPFATATLICAFAAVWRVGTGLMWFQHVGRQQLFGWYYEKLRDKYGIDALMKAGRMNEADGVIVDVLRIQRHRLVWHRLAVPVMAFGIWCLVAWKYQFDPAPVNIVVLPLACLICLTWLSALCLLDYRALRMAQRLADRRVR